MCDSAGGRHRRVHCATVHGRFGAAMRSLWRMGLFAAVAAVLLASGGSKPIPAGCEKRCEKKYVPCSGDRAEDQMMCVEVVRRCEIRCEGGTPAGAERTAAAPRASKK